MAASEQEARPPRPHYGGGCEEKQFKQPEATATRRTTARIRWIIVTAAAISTVLVGGVVVLCSVRDCGRLPRSALLLSLSVGCRHDKVSSTVLRSSLFSCDDEFVRRYHRHHR